MQRIRSLKAVISIILVLGSLIFTSIAAYAASAEAILSAEELAVGDRTRLSIVINGGSSITKPEIPPLDGLQLNYLGQSNQIQIINGQYSSSVTFNYSVVALRTGEYNLGPFEIQAGQERVRTNPVKLMVVDGPVGGGNPPAAPTSQKPENGSGEKLRLEMELSKTQFYLGEQIPVTIKLYVGKVQVDKVSYPVLNQPEFIVDRINKPTQKRVVIDGNEYQLVEFNALVTPVRSGSFKLGPARLSCDVLVRTADPFFGGFFDDYDKQTVEVKGDPVQVSIRPLPDAGKPADFSGAVGTFNLQATATPTEVLQGDPVTLKITVSGKGNLQSAGPPVLTKSEGFKIYDAQKKSSGDGKITYEQVVIPTDLTAKSIGPLVFSYFNPATGRYHQVSSQAIPLTVKANPNFDRAVLSGNLGSGGNETLGKDVVYIKEDPGKLQSRQNRLYLQPWYWLIHLMPLLFLTIVLLKQSHLQMLHSNTPRSRAMRAGLHANKGLAKAKSLLAGEKYNECLDELHLTIRSYLAERFNLTATGMTGAVVEKLAADGVGAEILAKVKEFFDHYDFYKFTGAKLDEASAKQLWESLNTLVTMLNNPESNGKIQETAGRRGFGEKI